MHAKEFICNLARHPCRPLFEYADHSFLTHAAKNSFKVLGMVLVPRKAALQSSAVR